MTWREAASLKGPQVEGSRVQMYLHQDEEGLYCDL
jgi:hypothetical protein